MYFLTILPSEQNSFFLLKYYIWMNDIINKQFWMKYWYYFFYFDQQLKKEVERERERIFNYNDDTIT